MSSRKNEKGKIWEVNKVMSAMWDVLAWANRKAAPCSAAWL